MRIETLRPRPAAAFPCAVLFLAMLGASPASAAIGERHVQPSRERLRLPLGAGGAGDPIAHATRKVERELAGVGKTLSRERWMASPRPQRRLQEPETRDMAGGQPEPGIPALGAPGKPRLLSITEFQASSAWPQPLREAEAQPRIVLAAIDRARPGPDGVLSDGHRLPWAGVPKLPPLLSADAEPSQAAAAVPLPNPRPERRERVLAGQPSSAPLPFLAPTRSQTAVAHIGPVLSRAPRIPLSLPGASLPSLDPLASPRRDAQPPAKAPLAGPQFILPFEYGHVSSLYNQGRRHPAIDLAGKMGAPVFSTSHGQRVIFAAARGGYGNAVITRDADGREHLYGHLSAIQTRVGATLAQGERLGLLGSTGFSTGPHVHYEVKDRRGAHINPVTLLFPNGVNSGYRWAAVAIPRVPTAEAALR